MNNKILITSVTGAVIVLLTLFFFGSEAAGIILILFLTLIMSVWISEDAARHLQPNIFAFLADDAQTIIVENSGTAVATSVQVKIIPEDIRYEIGELAPDQKHQYQLSSMLREGKAAVSWEKKDGTRAEKIFRLSGYGENSADPLRPTFPLFSWKEK